MSGRSGKWCAAMGCDNTHAHGVSLHSFPLNKPALCKQWTAFVQKKRNKWSGPTKHSVLCSDHFIPESYPIQYQIMASMGQTPKRKMLNEDAIPTMQSPHVISPCGYSDSEPKTKHPRIAFVKRENARIIEQYNQVRAACATTISEGIEEIQGIEVLPHSMTFDQSPPVEKTRSFGTSCNISVRKKSARTQVTPSGIEKACQTRPPKALLKSIAVQCNILKDEIKRTSDPEDRCDTLSESSWESTEEHDSNDPTYQQPDLEESSESSDGEYSCSSEERASMGQDRLFLVSECKLLVLFQKCFHCSKPAFASVTRVFGSMVKLQQDCALCGRTSSWDSQTMTGSIPTGNFRLSCGILFSGSLQTKALKVLQFMNVPVISTDTFLKHQRYYLQPAVLQVWEQQRQVYASRIAKAGRPICIGGDGRCDSPGHSAKFGSYSVMDLDQGVIVDIQLVQSNEVKSSCHMEKEGLIRSVKYLGSAGIEIGTIVTDRHVQIVKGLKKRLFALSKEKECDELRKWIKSITNHLYWTASSTPNGDGVLMLEKWKSLTNHIVNVHEGHGTSFRKCEHAELTGQERRKRWLKPGSKCCEKLLDLISSRQMRKDIPMLSPRQQTSELEGYHSVINHFAPKMNGFSYHGMMCRLILAAMHHNENGRRQGALTKTGETRYKIVYPKQKMGDYTVREVKTDATFVYVEDLVDCSTKLVHSTPMAKSCIVRQTPPALCSSYPRPIKEKAVAELQSRFNKN